MKRVLVVDDDVAVQRQCREILEAEGFEVYCESSLGSARRFLRNRAAEALLLDLFLPDGCGFELFTSNADLVSDISVIGMTSVYQGSANATLLTVRYPMRAILNKPIGVTNLVEVLRGVFGSDYPKPPDWVHDRSKDERTVVSVHDAFREDLRQDEIVGRNVPRIAEEWGVTSTSGPVGEDFVSPLEPSAGGSSGTGGRALMSSPGEADGWDPTASDEVPPVHPPEMKSDQTVVVSRKDLLTQSGGTQPVQRPRGLARSGWDREAPGSSSTGWLVMGSSSGSWSLAPRNPEVEGLIVPASLDPRRVAVQGSLDITPFPALLARIARGGWSGSLLLRRDQVKKVVFVLDGVPVAVKSNLLYECLGRLLVREGAITQDQCEQSVQRLKAERRMQGELLVEMGALPQSELGAALSRQFQTKFFDVFAWSQGLYRFRDSAPGDGLDMGPMGDPGALIASGVRHAFPADRIRIDLAAQMNQTPTLLVARRDLDVLNLPASESEWTDLIDGRRTLASIVSATGGAEGIYRMVYGLICLGVLAFRAAD